MPKHAHDKDHVDGPPTPPTSSRPHEPRPQPFTLRDPRGPGDPAGTTPDEGGVVEDLDDRVDLEGMAALIQARMDEGQTLAEALADDDTIQRASWIDDDDRDFLAWIAGEGGLTRVAGLLRLLMSTEDPLIRDLERAYSAVRMAEFGVAVVAQALGRVWQTEPTPTEGA